MLERVSGMRPDIGLWSPGTRGLQSLKERCLERTQAWGTNMSFILAILKLSSCGPSRRRCALEDVIQQSYLICPNWLTSSSSACWSLYVHISFPFHGWRCGLKVRCSWWKKKSHFMSCHRVSMDVGLCATLGDHRDLNLMYVLLSSPGTSLEDISLVLFPKKYSLFDVSPPLPRPHPFLPPCFLFLPNPTRFPFVRSFSFCIFLPV